MSDDVVCCAGCSFKCCKSQLYKTKGKCPKCGKKMSKEVANDCEVD